MNPQVTIVTVPQLGVNDAKALITEWRVQDGETVALGQCMCVLETAKATQEVHAEKQGVLLHLVSSGNEVLISGPIAVIGPDRATAEAARDETLRLRPVNKETIVSPAGNAGSVRATEKARELARQLNVNLSEITATGIIQASDVRSYHVARGSGSNARLPEPADIHWTTSKRPVLIYGAGRGGETVRECLLLLDAFQVVGFVDDNLSLDYVANLPVFRARDLPRLRERGVEDIALAIANANTRLRILRECNGVGIRPLNVIHPTAFLAPSVQIGCGNFIKARAIVDTACRIGDGCIIDNGVVIAHDNQIEDGCHLAPGTAMGSSIRVGQGTIIGIGAAVATKLTIGRYCVISVGSTVVRDVPDYSVIEGVPGRIVGSRKSAS